MKTYAKLQKPLTEKFFTSDYNKHLILVCHMTLKDRHPHHSEE